MTKLNITKKTEHFNVNGGVQASTVFLVRDQDGSLLFVFRKDSGRWVMTQEAPLGFCVGAQDAPESAEFPRADFISLQILEDAFNASQDDFLEKLTGMGLPFLRRRKDEEYTYWAQVAQKKAAIAAELRESEKEDRADLCGLDRIPVAGGWKLTFPDDHKDRLVLESLRGSLEIAEFRVSKLRRRVEFCLLSDGIDLAPALSPEKWVNPWMHGLELLPSGLRRIIAPTFQAISECLAQVLPEPRLPKEVSGSSFRGKGLSYFIKQLELDEEYTLAEACMDAYQASGTFVESALKPVWIKARKAAMARRLADMGLLWPISSQALSHECREAADRAWQGLNDLYPTPGLPDGVYGFRINSDPGFRVFPGFCWDDWLEAVS